MGLIVKLENADVKMGYCGVVDVVSIPKFTMNIVVVVTIIVREGVSASMVSVNVLKKIRNIVQIIV